MSSGDSSIEKTKQDRGEGIFGKRGFKFKQIWYGCLPDMTFVHRPKGGKETWQVDA